MSDNYVVYILRCRDGSLYTGITNNLEKRLVAHESGKGAKYTRGRGPFTVVYTQDHDSKGEALKAEIAIKAMQRSEKLALIEKREERG